MITERVKYLRDNLFIEFRQKDNFLYVDSMIRMNSNSLYFACYLFMDGEVIEKTNYQANGNFSFKIKKTSLIQVKIFIREKDSEFRTSKLFNIGLIHIISKNYLYHKDRNAIELFKTSGKLLFEENILVFPSFDPCKINLNEIFNIDPFCNRSWVWRVQQLTHVIYLVSYLQINFSYDLLNLIKKQILNWYNYSQSDLSNDNNMLWHDHATALRLQNIVYIFNFLLENNYLSDSEKLFDNFIDIIELHLNKLIKEEFYSKNTNHGFDQALILLETSLECCNFIKCTEYVYIAEQRILNEIKFAFSDDGGHKENSPSYLNFGIKQCLMAINIFDNYELKNSSLDFIYNLINKSSLALAYMTKPDGYLPLIGDTSQYKVVDIFKNYRPDNYNYFKYSITKGKVGRQPVSNSLILSDSGYAIYRSNWSTINFEDSIHLVFKASFHSNYHRHDDDLSVTLYAFGEDWIVDGGIYKYDEKDNHRRYIRSHYSHNLFSPDNVKALRDKIDRHDTFLKDCNTEKKFDFNVKGYSAMFKNYENHREILVSNDIISIFDKCCNLINNNFTSTSRFFIDASKIVTIVDNIVYIKGVKKTLIVEFLSESNLQINLVKNDLKLINGWLSKNNNSLYQSNLLEINCKSNNFESKLNYSLKFV